MRPYLKLCIGLSGMAFTLADVQRTLEVTPGSAKVIVSRLKSAGQVLPLERGRYRLVKQVTLVKLQELKRRNQKLYQLALEIYRKYPDLKMLVLYGSQVTGDADRFSDYDVLMIPKTLPESKEKDEVVRELEKKLRIKLHLTMCSEESYRMFVTTELHLKFWLSEAIILDEAGLFGLLPPTAKLGYSESLRAAENYMETASDGSPREASYYLIALKIALMLDHAMKLDYNFKNVRREIEELVDRYLLLAVRKNPVSPGKIKRKHIENLRMIVKEKLKQIRVKLDLLGQNESDLFWRSKLGLGV